MFGKDTPSGQQQGGQSYATPLLPHPRKTELREVEKAAARLFSTVDGQKLLAHLQGVTCRALESGVSAAELRHMEGQRALFATILRLIERGRMG